MAVCAGGCAMQKKNPLVHEVPGLGTTIVCHQRYSAALTGHDVGLYFFFCVGRRMVLALPSKILKSLS